MRSQILSAGVLILALSVSGSHAQEDTAMKHWEPETTTTYVEIGRGQGIWVKHVTLVRSDGVRIELTGGGRELQDFFTYSDGAIFVKFFAMRYDGDIGYGFVPLDTWNVHVGVVVGKLRAEYVSSRVEMSEIERMVHAIEEALPQWPSAGEREAPTPKQINIRTGGFGAQGKSVSLDIHDVLHSPDRYEAYVSTKTQYLYLLDHHLSK